MGAPGRHGGWTALAGPPADGPPASAPPAVATPAALTAPPVADRRPAAATHVLPSLDTPLPDARPAAGCRRSERGSMPPRPFARSRAPRCRARSTLARTRGPELRERQQVASLCRKRALKLGALRDCARRCVYCATPLCLESATLDHVVPRAHGGPHVAGNVVAACGRCNRLKADLLPTEFFLQHPWAGENFMRYARGVHRMLKRHARRAVSLAHAA